ncbi:FAS1-like dehydratase domain-containing protein [Nocardioides pantholopis]|uniref:FAS1-like dehydratase domain-containing protein n=1 Tax=Nocardioides pantholopis TaxID=2483798 RepID=UPI000F0919A5|nr:MaoC family dehydratase N-terminal domain-containing protein [Nocardioides pantholopis]
MSLLAPEAAAELGRSQTYRPYLVTDVDIAKYCHVMGIEDPVHLDPEVARRRGHRDVVAPIGYHMVIRHALPNIVPIGELAADGGSPDMTPPSSATRRMAGETTVEFLDDLVAGDGVVVTKTLSGLREKEGRSGPLAFVTYDLEYAVAGTPKVRETYVRILR